MIMLDDLAEQNVRLANIESPVQPTKADTRSKPLKQDEKISELCVMESGEDEAYENVSICTILPRYPDSYGREASSDALKLQDNEILSVSRLIDGYQPKKSSVVDGSNMIEIDLIQDNEMQVMNLTSTSEYKSPNKHGYELSSKNNHSQRNNNNNNPICKGFDEAELKISFANRKMREYFELLKNHGSEKVRLYQFFKSIRTELVACLIFTVITSHALIVCRTHLFETDTIARARPWPQLLHDGPNQIIGQTQVGRTVGAGKQAAMVHIVSGLVSSFAVASLTQVFGHISGCHLIPSVSVALYVKGHISRARLTSYLAAQSVGSMLGVGLLGLLTASQLTPEEFRELLRSSAQLKYSEIEHSKLGEFSNKLPGRGGDSTAKVRRRRRRKRRKRNVVDRVSNLDETFLGNGETILPSIAQQRKLDKRQATHQTGNVTYEPQKTIIANVGTSQVGKFGLQNAAPSSAPTTRPHVSSSIPLSSSDSSTVLWTKLSRSATKTPYIETSALDIGGEVALSFSANLNRVLREPSSTASSLPLDDRSRCDHDRTGGILTMRAKLSSDQDGFERRNLNGFNLDKKLRAAAEEEDDDSKFLNNRKYSRARRQAVRDIQPEKVIESAETSQVGPKYYINLLEFALPDTIMSSESIRQCINKQLDAGVSLQRRPLQQQQQQQRQSPQTKNVVENDELGQLASTSFDHCLSLSNASQMFVFQLLATLIIVLSYLVNVDPRRLDLGFKSLSIGLSYFVADITTVSLLAATL